MRRAQAIVGETDFILDSLQSSPLDKIQKLADHRDIKTTKKYYLVVQESDIAMARKAQSIILKSNLNDLKLIHLGQNQDSKTAAKHKCLAT